MNQFKQDVADASQGRSDHLFTSEDMISGYSEAKKAKKQRRRKRVDNKENMAVHSHTPSTTTNNNASPPCVLQTPSGTNTKAASRLSHDRTPLSCLTNIGQSSNTYRDKGKATMKENVFHSNRNLFEEITTGQLEDICESYDDTVENSRIHGLSDSEDFYSDDSYEEDYCTSQSCGEDTEDDWINQKNDEDHIKPNLRGKRKLRIDHVVPEEYASLGPPSVRCTHCNALLWKEERVNKNVTRGTQNLEKPLILILASCRVGSWKNEVDISNVGATTFYLNFKHQSVLHLRRMLAQPQFYKKIFKETEQKLIPLLKLADIKKLGKEFVEKEVLIHVNIRQVEEPKKWYISICTSCDNEIEVDNGLVICSHCPRIVPHPDKIYKLNVVVADDSGSIKVIMEDREVRTIVGIRSRELYDENEGQSNLPKKLLDLANKDYTMLILIQEMNVVDGINVYKATNVCNGFQMTKIQDNPESIQHSQTTTQATPSYQIQQLSSEGKFSSS